MYGQFAAIILSPIEYIGNRLWLHFCLRLLCNSRLSKDRSVGQEQVQLETELGEIIFIQFPRISSAQLVSCRLTRYNGQFMSIDQRPCTRIRRMFVVPIKEPDERDDECVVRPRVAELMPPVFAD